MGSDKALVELDGRPLVMHVAGTLRTITPHVIVVGRATPLAGLPTVPDHTTGRRGPAAGLETALLQAAGYPVLLVGTDQPFVRAATLRNLMQVAHADAVVPLDGGILQTTCALYRGPCLSAARTVLSHGGGSLRDVLDAVDAAAVPPATWQAWGEDGRSWFSVDTPDDLAEGVDRFGSQA
jgi:molybdopterin-guanine dinucleotide biosynthesis protein A